MENMSVLTVGKPLDGAKGLPEGIMFDFEQAGGLLRIAYHNPTDTEIREVKQGAIKLGLLEKNGIVFLFVKFGNLSWTDCPYHVALSKQYELMELGNTQGYSVTVLLVNTEDGVLKVLKFIGLPHKMSQTFKKLVERQRAAPFEKEAYNATLQQIYANYSTTDLLKHADIYSLKED